MSRQVYFEHDSRGPSTSSYRPNLAMGRQRKFRDHSRGFSGGKSRLTDIDGDVDMNTLHGPVERRFNPYGQRNQNKKNKDKRKSGKSKHEYGFHPHGSELSSWFRISIPFGKKHGKAFILKSLVSLLKSPLIPYNFQFNNNFAEFYVNDHNTARQLREISRRITTPDGFKMVVNTSRCPAPNPSIDPETTEHLKTIMSSRYDTISHTLDLSKFHMDENMKLVGLHLPLNKPVVLSTVAKIIKEHIPQLEALVVSDNKLYTLDPLCSISSVCKQLKSLVLQNNRLRAISELNSLKGLEITDLVLDGNPLCDDFKNKASYISAVRERFPKLLRLDHHELPPPIGFDLGPETLPASKKSFFAEEVKDLVIQFLDQYYTIYDSGDRSKLLDAYHDHACFSLCLSKSTSHKACGSVLAAYNQDNRNLLKASDYTQRFKLLKQGKLSIVSALSELPQTMHDPSSFSVDIFHVSPGLMSFSVTGVFKEVGADINNATLKTFSRIYVVAAQGTGFTIVNETLFIAHASQDQQAKAFKVPAPTPSPSPAPCDEKTPAEKQQLVIELCNQTGMNLDFSSKCLEEMEWDYQRALAAFMKFQSEGRLPPEAFVK